MKNVIAAAILLAASACAQAVCEQGDLSGKWKLFMTNSTDWGICTVKFSASSGAAKGSCKSSQGKDSVKGKFKLDSSCALTGYIDDGEVRGNLKGAQLSRDRQAMHGIIELFGSGVLFSALKV